MENNLLNARFCYIDIPDVVQAIERGDNGWLETTIEKGLVPCTSPIKGALYQVRHHGGPLAKYLGYAVVIRLLPTKAGRVFVDTEGRMMISTELSQEAFEHVAEEIANDVLDMAGYSA